MTYPIEVHEESIKQYVAGVPIKLIAWQTGMKLAALYKLIERSGVERRQKKARTESIILALHSEGLSKAEIARQSGYSWQTVHNTIKKAGG